MGNPWFAPRIQEFARKTMKANVRPGAHSEAPGGGGRHQHPGPENQDSRHMIDQPRGSFLMCLEQFLINVCKCQTTWAREPKTPGKRKIANSNFLVRISSGGVGGLPRKGLGARKFVMPLEIQVKQTFWGDIPGLLLGCPRGARKV